MEDNSAVPGFGAVARGGTAVWQSELPNCDGGSLELLGTIRTACRRVSFQAIYRHDRSNA